MAQPEKVGGAMAYLAHMVEPALQVNSDYHIICSSVNDLLSTDTYYRPVKILRIKPIMIISGNF